VSFTSEAEKKARKGRGCAGGFFAVFMLIGLGASAFFAWPILGIVQARGWRETPCTILASAVKEHSDSDGSTYSVELTYEYVVNDQTYTSSRYKFMSMSSSGYQGKKAIVDRLGPGTKTVCYVNRRNPSEAVIERGFTTDMLFGLIPLVFVAVGAGGLFGAFFFKGKPKSPHERGGALAARAPSKQEKGVLKSSTSPGARLGCAIGLATFWNGIISFFVVDLFRDWSSGRFEGCAAVIMLPFVLVGLAAVAYVGYCLLALFNPRPTVRMHGEPALGETVEIEWEIRGNCDRMTRFAILLEGREEATYRRGTSTTTEKSIFESIELVALTRGKDMRRGRVKAAIPAGSMHTFKASNNKFLWHVHVKGEIPRWPDLGEEYELEVKPQRPGAAS
jgi:hypothetical protein